jgi:hypothetical protein
VDEMTVTWADWLCTYTFKDWLCDQPDEDEDGNPIPYERYEEAWADGYGDIIAFLEDEREAEEKGYKDDGIKFADFFPPDPGGKRRERVNNYLVRPM